MNTNAEPIVGIDLGTTNSLVAVWRDGNATLVPNALGRLLTPSCVSVLDDGTIAVGDTARERLQTHASQSAALFKRRMGTSHETRLGERRFRPEELSALVLRALKADAEAYLGMQVTRAVITVPAYFSDAQRKATRIAGELAGLKVERLLNEPTAAALAYGLQAGGESHFLVFDLGGGTFDVSVLELFDGVMEVRASTGDNFLGGEDFSESLMREFVARSGLADKFDASGSDALAALPAPLNQLVRAAAEQAKLQLGAQPEVEIAVHWDGVGYAWTASQADFARVSEFLLDRLRHPIEQALRDARIRAAELDTIVLAGGATRMPGVRRLVSRMFGRFPVTELDPDHVVALGAAVQAGLVARDAALDEVVMTDVAPYSLGIETAHEVGQQRYSHGHYLPIIERNSVIPVSRVERVQPLYERQSVLQLRIYQGESRMVNDNVFLGQVEVKLPVGAKSQAQVDVRFTYDVSGILEVEAVVVATGEREVVVIQGNQGVMSDEEQAQRLAALSALKIHPRDQAENQFLLSRADRLYQMSLGPQRQTIGQAAAQFQAVLETQDHDRIRTARAAFRGLLDELETQPPF